ncbi:TonB-dependent receptor domain-containing protein [Sphingomonas sp. TDK1]|uniref:TonB-dependent receptor domain-containing protein n=1 Tax=Sphingomonas sp. TDK1 TaxID=453247 RepID=UPI0007DA084F|nr:TonB-dependent receptor [Sphingomonas sp. TDK1]OAN57568.1 TonB-dependent receptor [Sphingomonas sp. TDK1]
MAVQKLAYIRSGASALAILCACATTTVQAQDGPSPQTAWEASRTVDDNASISTGVAKARDPLNSATSTSAFKERDISALAPISLADLLRNVPGIRAEAGTGVANNSYTVRGLPLVNAGAKYLQLQEDGLPVLEFGDFFVAPSDIFLRADLNVAQIESIRGGSSSTFASNAPGGVVNLVSKTGEVEGGSVQASSGIDYKTHRLDADYGGQLGGGWRFHIGGFYRQGEGPRHTGYDALQGGQVKLNVTRQFANGYIRFNAKLLDDRFPYYYTYPVAVSGTNEKPSFRNVANFDISSDTAQSRYISTRVAPGFAGAISNTNMQDDMRAKAKALGFEAQFTLAGWTLAERFRYADNSGVLNQVVPLSVAPAADLASQFTGQPGNVLTYATGPAKGSQLNPATVNGNGLLMATGFYRAGIDSMRNITNDFRASRAWNLGGSTLTTTFGVYKALQDLNTSEGMTSVFQDVVGGGKSALVDVRRANGTLITQNGVVDYGFLGQPGIARNADVRYDITAPYASFNLQKGRFALGGSLRYDTGSVRGTAFADQSTRAQDMNGDGQIDLDGPEAAVPFIDPATRWPVHYNYHYVSYSAGLNYRVAEALSVFARYSRGARAGADSILFSPALDRATGGLADSSAAYDPVRQVEGGFKYRNGGVIVNVTAFHALTRETNSQIYNDANGNQVYGVVQRSYRTYGAELESRVRKGPFSVSGNLTLSGGKITAANDPAVVGKKPRHQAAAIYSLTPQFEKDLVTVGVNIAGQTSSYSQDVNQLKMPSFTTVGAFVQVRPIERLSLALNASNLFNTVAFVDIGDATIPSYGVVLGRTLPGRMLTASARVFF